tara:strand:- start:417 stop:932 length:516 start_codon:yes stop_codon:yes gene_type:complete
MRTIAAVLLLCPLIGCGSGGADYSSPSKTVLTLQEAYRNEDIEAAVSCNDFVAEARIKLAEHTNEDDDLINVTAKQLEKDFRDKIRRGGFPDVSEIKSEFGEPTQHETHSDVTQITETVSWSNDRKSTENYSLVKSGSEWKLVFAVSNMPYNRIPAPVEKEGDEKKTEDRN